MSVSAEEAARPERARVVRLRRVAFRAELGAPAREDDHRLRSVRRRAAACGQEAAVGCRRALVFDSGAGDQRCSKLEERLTRFT